MCWPNLKYRVENTTPCHYENYGLNTWCHTLFYRHSSSAWKYVYLTSQFDTDFLADTGFSLIITSENCFLSSHLARSWQPCLRYPGFITSHWTGAKQHIWAQGPCENHKENPNLLRFNKISPQHQALLHIKHALSNTFPRAFESRPRSWSLNRGRPPVGPHAGCTKDQHWNQGCLPQIKIISPGRWWKQLPKQKEPNLAPSATATGTALTPCPLLSHGARQEQCMFANPNLGPHQKTPVPVAVERARGGTKGLAGIPILRHTRNGCMWDKVEKYLQQLCLGWVWPWLLAHRQEGPLQDLTCPGRTEVVKSMPTNELWPHPVSCLGWSRWDILEL